LATHDLPAGGLDSPTWIDGGGNVYYTGSDGPVTAGAAQVQPDGGLCLITGFFQTYVVEKSAAGHALVAKLSADGSAF
jgi:hypothetical protein